ncbi:imidazoleglycerol-phosphate dehydratase HisB [bacterium]|nr:imidazoleglycerol-phosphate dehydratase HisB [bacterium]
MTMAVKKRTATVKRKTKETDIQLSVNLDGNGKSGLDTGVPFFEHMLTLLAGHSLMDIQIKAKGDLEVDQHHLVEDIGIALGQALLRALGDKRQLVRYGAALIPMDESLVQVTLDISGRPYLNYQLKLRQKKLGDFDTELVIEFFRALANAAGITVHIIQQTGGNTHHLVEAAFKGLGRALRKAIARDARQKGVPSTKGSL